MSTCKATIILGEKDICKDCMKADGCKHKANLDKDSIIGMSVEECEYFKDRSKFIEMPCKVGDTVWRIEDVWHLDDKATGAYHYEKEVVEFRVRSISISYNSKGVWTKKFRICQVKNSKTIDHQHDVYFCYFGKTVFPNKEEAEQALKNQN